METAGERWRLAGYHLALTLPVLAIAAARWDSYRPDDLRIATTAGRAILDGQLDVYVQMPEAQMGPLALILAGGLPRWLFVALVAAALPAILHLIGAFPRRLPHPLVAVAVVLAVGVPWSILGISGHADDPLVYLGAAVMIYGLRRDRAGLVALGCVLAMAGKPTAVLLLPLLLATRSKRAVVAGLLGSGLVWLPFVAADPVGFARAGDGITTVWPGTLPMLLGEPVGAAYPEWVRPAQLVGGLLLGAWLVRRRQPVAAVVAVFAWRALLEPAPHGSYLIPLVVFAVGLSVYRREVLVAAFAAWLAALTYEPVLVSTVRNVGLLVVVWAVVVTALRRPSDERPTAAEARLPGVVLHGAGD